MVYTSYFDGKLRWLDVKPKSGKDGFTHWMLADVSCVGLLCVFHATTSHTTSFAGVVGFLTRQRKPRITAVVG